MSLEPAGAREHRAAGPELLADPRADRRVGEALLRPGRAALLDPDRHEDEEPRARPLVGIGVERDIEALGPGVVDEREHLLGRPGEGRAVVEVGDVGRRLSPAADLDRLPERVQEPVAERVAHVGVVDAAEAAGLAGQRRELGRRRVRAGRVVEPGAEPERPLLHRLAQHRPHRVGRPARRPATSSQPRAAMRSGEFPTRNAMLTLVVPSNRVR